jgi:hypothetical protein
MPIVIPATSSPKMVCGVKKERSKKKKHRNKPMDNKSANTDKDCSKEEG